MCIRNQPIPRLWVPIIPLKEMRIPAAVKKHAEKNASHVTISWFVWLQEHHGTLLARTFAAKNTKKAGLEIYETMREVPDSQFYIQRNMWCEYMQGWKCWFPAENEVFECDWRTEDVKKKPGIFYRVINPEVIATIPAFQYCGWKPGCDIAPLNYLRKWLLNPGLEFFAKIGLEPRDSLVKKATKDGNFRKWLRTLPQSEVKMANWYGPTATIEAYKTHGTILECSSRLEEHRRLRNMIRSHAKEILAAGHTPEKIREYILSLGKGNFYHNLGLYGDYIRAAAYLHLDLNDTKVAFPRELKRMHDMRIAQMAELKEKEDRKRKRQMAQRFREVSQELRRFETVGKAYCIIIPKEPKDLVTEGRAMNNCVGHMGYELKMANGKSFIAFMRTVADREHSFITIEYDLEKKTLRQCYGHANSRPKPDEQAFADEWAANVTKKLREEERIARKKAAEEAMQEALGPIEKKYKPGAEPRREAIA